MNLCSCSFESGIQIIGGGGGGGGGGLSRNELRFYNTSEKLSYNLMMYHEQQLFPNDILY